MITCYHIPLQLNSQWINFQIQIYSISFLWVTVKLMALYKVSFDVNICKDLKYNAHNLPLPPVIFMQGFSTTLHIFQEKSEIRVKLHSTKLKMWPWKYTQFIHFDLCVLIRSYIIENNKIRKNYGSLNPHSGKLFQVPVYIRWVSVCLHLLKCYF